MVYNENEIYGTEVSQRKILKSLQEPECKKSQSQIIKETELTKATIIKHLKHLKEEKLIKITGGTEKRAFYGITKKGIIFYRKLKNRLKINKGKFNDAVEVSVNSIENLSISGLATAFFSRPIKSEEERLIEKEIQEKVSPTLYDICKKTSTKEIFFLINLKLKGKQSQNNKNPKK